MKKQLLLISFILFVTIARGADSPILRIHTTQWENVDISIWLKAEFDNTPFRVDFGNGPQDIVVNRTATLISGTLVANLLSLYGDSERLTYLKCYNQGASSIYLTELKALTHLDCSYNDLTSLDVRQCNMLEELRCVNNKIKELNLILLSKLKKVACYGNQLTALSLHYNDVLEELNCDNNQLTTLNITAAPKLKVLKCNNNKIEELSCSDTPELVTLQCRGNALTNLNVMRCPDLEDLQCSGNELDRLFIWDNTKLIYLYCGFNKLTALDLTKNTELIKFYCGWNQFTSIDVSKNTKLMELECSTNQLTDLNTTGLTLLKWLKCYDNAIESLDFNTNTILNTVDCSGNKLSQLDVSGNSQLRDLKCENNRFTLATLPTLSSYSTYGYVNQQPLAILKNVVTSETIDLSDQDNINGESTSYTWKLKDGTTLAAGTVFTVSGGQTTFHTVPSDSVYCEMTNPAFPNLTGDLAYKTTCTKIQVATAVEKLEESVVRILGGHQCVSVEVDQSAQVTVFNTSGQVIGSAYVTDGSANMVVPHNGVYIVLVEGQAFKHTRKVFVR